MPDSRDLFAEAHASYSAAIAQSRVERMASEARIARLKHAAELERQGRMEEAAAIVRDVRAEQEREGIAVAPVPGEASA